MRIPRSIKIKRSKWNITLDETKLDTSIYDGLCLRDKKEILIDPKLCKSKLEITFIHELLHACWPEDIISDKKEEAIIDKLARTMAPVLNRLLRVQK